jgi:hypothetical protein
MPRMRKLWALSISALLVAGCAAHVGTAGGTYVPKDAAATCRAHCDEIGLRLDSVVIMADNVGCVCAASAAPMSTTQGRSAAAGMAAVLEEEAAQQNAQPHGIAPTR